jgi:transposase
MRGPLAPGTKVYLWCAPADMRKGFDGLSALAAEVVKMDPFSGHLFLFRSRKGDYLKVLHWDGSGICLFSKRLERDKFVWPPQVDESLQLTAAQLALLIEGMDWRRTQAPRVRHDEIATPAIL